jgi:hypothetical protein
VARRSVSTAATTTARSGRRQKHDIREIERFLFDRCEAGIGGRSQITNATTRANVRYARPAPPKKVLKSVGCSGRRKRSSGGREARDTLVERA